MFSVKEFKSQERTISLFLSQRIRRGDVVPGFGQWPSIKANLCLADRVVITDLFQLSKFFPLKGFETRGIPGLSEG